MFYNIFEKAKTNLKFSKTAKPIIIADIHEKNSLIISELKNSKDIMLCLRPLKIGDYLIKNIIVERKTVNDFLSSLINKRLFNQINQIKDYPERLLIVEGDLNNDLYINKPLLKIIIRGAILSLILNHKIQILFTKDCRETAEYLILIARQKSKSKVEPSLHSRIPKTLKLQKRYILEAFPRIGPKKSEQLINKFHSLKSIFDAKDQELKQILKNDSEGFKSILEDKEEV